MVVKRLLWAAARQVAADPRVQDKAAELAAKASAAARPRLENAGRHIGETAREAAREADPLQRPGAFIKSFRRRLLPPEDQER